jgi:hypothetical protein
VILGPLHAPERDHRGEIFFTARTLKLERSADRVELRLEIANPDIAPLPAAEAARQAGGAGGLKAALTSAATSGLILGAVGAGVGAIAGSLIGSGATGAALGGAIGAGEGGLSGAVAGPQKAEQQATTQLNALALQPGSVAHDFTVSGYVFFPKGEYRQLQMVLVDGESGDTRVINRPW